MSEDLKMQNKELVSDRSQLAKEIIKLAIISQLVLVILVICAFFYSGLDYLESFFAVILPGSIVLSVFSFFASAMAIEVAKSKPVAIVACIVAFVPVFGLIGLVIANLQIPGTSVSSGKGASANSTMLRVLMFGTWGLIIVLTISFFVSFSADDRRLRRAVAELLGGEDTPIDEGDGELTASEKEEIVQEFTKIANALDDFDRGNSELTRKEVNDYLVYMETIMSEVPDEIGPQQKSRFEKLNGRRSELMSKAKVSGAAAKKRVARSKNKGNESTSGKTKESSNTSKTAIRKTRPRKKKTTDILIATEIGESGKLVISQGNIRWLGDKSAWPSETTINKTVWKPSAEAKFSNSTHKYFPGRADFESATVEVLEGRGDVRLVRTNIGVTLQINDPEDGSSPYKVKVSMSKVGNLGKGKATKPKSD